MTSRKTIRSGWWRKSTRDLALQINQSQGKRDGTPSQCPTFVGDIEIKSVRPDAITAGTWNAVDIVIRQGFNFLAMLVLARLLAPEDFGVISLVSFFSSIIIAVLQTGLGTALIQKSSISQAEESAAFWWSLIASAAVALALVFAGPVIADYYDLPVLAPLMGVASAHIVLTALSSVQSALLARELRFAVLAKAGIGSTLLSGVLAISAAAIGAGVWSLAIQLLSAALLNSILVWHFSGWRPVGHFSIATLRPLLAFGGYLSVSNFLEVAYTQGFAVIIGKRYGATELGLYNRASALQLVPSSAIAVILSRIALPMLSERAVDEQQLLLTFRRLIRFAMFMNVPLMCGMAVLADQIVLVLYGPHWASAGPILAILSLGAALLPLHAINLQLLLAQGRPDAFFWIEIAKKIVGLTCVVIGSFEGLIGLAWGAVIASLLALFMNTYMTKRNLNFGLLPQLADLADIFLCSGVMVAVVLICRMNIDLPLIASLPLFVTIGAGTYFALGMVLRLRSFREASEVGAALLQRRRVRIEL